MLKRNRETRSSSSKGKSEKKTKVGPEEAPQAIRTGAPLPPLPSDDDEPVKDLGTLNKMLTLGKNLINIDPLAAGAQFQIIIELLSARQDLSSKEKALLELVNNEMEYLPLSAPGSSSGSSSGSPSGSSSGSSSGDSEARVPPTPVADDKLTRSLDDLEGLTSEKAEIRLSFILPSEYPNLFKEAKGFLMWGMPGTGKTMIAKALTKTLREERGAPVNIYTLTGAELKGSKVGDTEKNIKLAFETAQKWAESTGNPKARAILFFDEIDAIAVDRAKNSEPVNVIATNALLQQMDGVTEYPNVIVIGATNRIWDIDSGVTRRFGFDLYVDMPSYAARAGLTVT